MPPRRLQQGRQDEQGQFLQLLDRRAAAEEEETLMRCTSMRLIPLTAGLLGIALFAPATDAVAVPYCTELATGVAGNPASSR
jgi:hypothetical protein